MEWSGPAIRGHRRSWKVKEGQRRSWMVFSHDWIDISVLWTLDLGFGTWIWDLDLGLGFGTGLGLDN